VTIAAQLPEDELERVADRVAAIVAERLEQQGEWLTVGEAAEYARCSRQRIYDLRSAGRLPKTGDGSRVLVARSALDDYIRGGV